ncbi:MAG: hypothetical protein JXR19_10080 [Bacteroidia bacterium]
MEAQKSIEVIERMFQESQASLKRNSFFFILWGVLMAVAGILDFMLFGRSLYWVVWPIAGMIGGIISSIYGSREEKRSKVRSSGDRIMKYTWGGFIIFLILGVVFSVLQGMSPSPIVLMLAGYATFISGGISKFTPLIYGAIALFIGAVVTGFYTSAETHGLVFSISIVLGYVYPGIKLMQKENA